MEPFSYAIFWHNADKTLAFFFLIASLCSLWIKKTPWVWGPLIALAFFFSFKAKLATIETLVFFSIIGFSVWGITYAKGLLRGLLIAIFTTVSLLLLLHKLPGFLKWEIFPKSALSPGAMRYGLSLQFDKPWIGFFILALYHPLISGKQARRAMLLKAIPLSGIGITLLIVFALQTHLFKYDFKLPSFLPVWMLANLFLVSLPEEAFFRGFLQREIANAIKAPWGTAAAIFTVALAFALLHLFWIRSPYFIMMVFLAGVLYGFIYQVTKSVEGSTLCHFGLNFVHIVFFTYPALQGS